MKLVTEVLAAFKTSDIQRVVSSLNEQQVCARLSTPLYCAAMDLIEGKGRIWKYARYQTPPNS